MRTIVCAIALLTMAAPAFAQNWTENQVGQYRYYNSDNGWSGSGNQVGQYYYQHFNGPNGQTRSCSSNTIGQYTYTNCN